MLLAVPNVSEGRDAVRISAIGSAFDWAGGLLDTHSDSVHNRSVYTLSGHPGELAQTVLEGAGTTVESIDMRSHEGAHPSIGALDVCPVVWTTLDHREEAIAEAGAIAEGIATQLEVPVFLYGELASSEERRERAYFRRGGLAELTRRMEAGELRADLGPDRPHPSAGATLVTARPPLAAFNLELDSADVEVAKQVASGLREAGGGLPGVRAIGLSLNRERTQVSTNTHDPIAVPLADVIAEAARLAEPLGARVVSTELIGLIPTAAMEGMPEDLLPAGFDPARHLIERRL